MASETKKVIKKTQSEKVISTKTVSSKTAKKTSKSDLSAQAGEFAVIFTGGKQYSVSVGDVVMVEKISNDHKKGDTIAFDKVLLVDNGTDTTIGTPYITGAQVTGEVSVVGREPKITVIKYKQKSRYFKKNGHRQPYVKVLITAIK